MYEAPITEVIPF